jgi:cell division initiation protein
MPLTSLDIKNKTFSTSLRGYSKDEVKAFLAVVSKELDDLRNERVSLAQKVDELSVRLATMEKMEGLLKDTLITAQKATTDIRDAAKKEAENIINKAKFDAENVKKEVQEQMRKINDRIHELESHKINLISQIKALLSNVTMLIDKDINQKKQP